MKGGETGTAAHCDIPHRLEIMSTNGIRISGHIIAAIFFIACFTLCCIGEPAAAEKTTVAETYNVTFAMNLSTSLLGRGSVIIWDDLLRLQAILKKDYGLNITIKKFNNWTDVIEKLEDGSVDVAWLPSYYYMQSQYGSEKSAIHPIAVYQSVGETSSKTCIYMMPESIDPGADQMLDSLFGKRIAIPDESAWALLNNIFEEQKYEFAPHYLFHNFHRLNRESSALALLFNAVDAVVIDELSMKYVMLETDERLVEALPIACSKPFPNTLIVVRDGFGEKPLKRIKNVLYNMHENADFAPFHNYFRQTAGRWVSAGDVDFSGLKQFYNTVKVKGWDKIYMSLPFEE